MQKRSLLLALNIFLLNSVSAQTEFPEFIDFGKLKPFQEHYLFENPPLWSWEIGRSAFELGYTAFNDAPELSAFFEILRKEHSLEIAVETGTYRGSSSIFFASRFDSFHTIDISPEYYQNAKHRFERNTNVFCHLGSSEQVLHQLLPSLKHKRTFFYLDAHWHDHFPLLDELTEIGKTHRDYCIIVIDDFKVPGRPDIKYDQYGDSECSYAFIKQKLDEVYTNYHFYYVIPKNIASRAKFIAIPNVWRDES